MTFGCGMIKEFKATRVKSSSENKQKMFSYSNSDVPLLYTRDTTLMGYDAHARL